MKRMLLGMVVTAALLTAGVGCRCRGGLCGNGACEGGACADASGGTAFGPYGQSANMGHVAYPYYTVRGPRDFLANFDSGL